MDPQELTPFERGADVVVCNLTRADIIKSALESPNKKEAARRLGISKSHLHRAVKGTDMDCFGCKRTVRSGRSPKLKKDKLLEVQGMLIKDAAKLLKMSYSAVRNSIIREGMQDLFPNQGEGTWISRRGYAGWGGYETQSKKPNPRRTE